MPRKFTKQQEEEIERLVFELSSNPKRMLVENGVMSCIKLFRASGIKEWMIVEVLFKFMMKELTPPTGITKADSTIWFAQARRFRRQLDEMIEAL